MRMLGQIRIPTGTLIRSFGESSINAYTYHALGSPVNTINNATERCRKGESAYHDPGIPSHSSPKGNLSVLVRSRKRNGIPHKYMQIIWKPFFTHKSIRDWHGHPGDKRSSIRWVAARNPKRGRCRHHSSYMAEGRTRCLN
jgi:hypothetical protein